MRIFGLSVIDNRPGPFGLTIHMREVKDCRVKRLRHETGQYVHEVESALVEWVTGAPRLEFRYLLKCGDVRPQKRAHLSPACIPVTCRKCLRRR